VICQHLERRDRAGDPLGPSNVGRGRPRELAVAVISRTDDERGRVERRGRAVFACHAGVEAQEQVVLGEATTRE